MTNGQTSSGQCFLDHSQEFCHWKLQMYNNFWLKDCVVYESKLNLVHKCQSNQKCCKICQNQKIIAPDMTKVKSNIKILSYIVLVDVI